MFCSFNKPSPDATAGKQAIIFAVSMMINMAAVDSYSLQAR
jgi:hypothetical protein